MRSRSSGSGAVNGWWTNVTRFSRSSHSNQGKLDDPAIGERVLLDEVEPLGQLGTQPTEHRHCYVGPVGHRQQQAAVGRSGPLADRAELRLR